MSFVAEPPAEFDARQPRQHLVEEHGLEPLSPERFQRRLALGTVSTANPLERSAPTASVIAGSSSTSKIFGVSPRPRGGKRDRRDRFRRVGLDVGLRRRLGSTRAREAKPEAAAVARLRAAVELVEEAGPRGGRDPGPAVAHLDDRPPPSSRPDSTISPSMPYGARRSPQGSRSAWSRRPRFDTVPTSRAQSTRISTVSATVRPRGRPRPACRATTSVRGASSCACASREGEERRPQAGEPPALSLEVTQEEVTPPSPPTGAPQPPSRSPSAASAARGRRSSRTRAPPAPAPRVRWAASSNVTTAAVTRPSGARAAVALISSTTARSSLSTSVTTWRTVSPFAARATGHEARSIVRSRRSARAARSRSSGPRRPWIRERPAPPVRAADDERLGLDDEDSDRELLERVAEKPLAHAATRVSTPRSAPTGAARRAGPPSRPGGSSGSGRRSRASSRVPRRRHLFCAASARSATGRRRPSSAADDRSTRDRSSRRAGSSRYSGSAFRSGNGVRRRGSCAAASFASRIVSRFVVTKATGASSNSGCRRASSASESSAQALRSGASLLLGNAQLLDRRLHRLQGGAPRHSAPRPRRAARGVEHLRGDLAVHLGATSMNRITPSPSPSPLPSTSTSPLPSAASSKK